MALTLHNSARKAACDAIAALLNNGQFALRSSTTDLAVLSFGATAFQAATSASPSVATSNSITPDNSPTPGTIDNFQLRSAGGATTILSGTVSESSGDLVVTETEIPGDAAEVGCPGGLLLSVQLA